MEKREVQTRYDQCVIAAWAVFKAKYGRECDFSARDRDDAFDAILYAQLTIAFPDLSLTQLLHKLL